jgi:formylglycine-generating enzyme required for sulfatase activity
MVEVPPCEFKLGEEDDAHAVRADAFKIGKFPVTNRLYHRFVRDADHSPPSHWVEGKVPLSLEDHPVVNVTWDDAVAYCDWMSSVSGTKYRLPTEVEWELTARGHEGTIYPWGDTFFAECCNCWEMAVGWTTPVNCFAEGISSFGALDLVGNVWEWCSTLYAERRVEWTAGKSCGAAPGLTMSGVFGRPVVSAAIPSAAPTIQASGWSVRFE